MLLSMLYPAFLDDAFTGVGNPEAGDPYVFTSVTSNAGYDYGNGMYPESYTAKWTPAWKHMDNLDHIRPNTGVPGMTNASAWTLTGREMCGNKDVTKGSVVNL